MLGMANIALPAWVGSIWGSAYIRDALRARCGGIGKALEQQEDMEMR